MILKNTGHLTLSCSIPLLWKFLSVLLSISNTVLFSCVSSCFRTGEQVKEASLVSESQNVSNCSVWFEDEERELVWEGVCAAGRLVACAPLKFSMLTVLTRHLCHSRLRAMTKTSELSGSYYNRITNSVVIA